MGDLALYRRRVERAVAASCDPAQPWAGRVAAAIRATLAFAEATPVAARNLTIAAAFRREGDEAAFAAMVDHFAALLSRGAPPVRRPERTARTIVTRIARQTLLHLETRPGAPLAEVAPDLILFALIPYTSLAEAQRHATSAAWDGPIL